MKVYQNHWRDGSWANGLGAQATAKLVLVFFSPDTLDSRRIEEIQSAYPNALLFGCSTAGEIHHKAVHDGTISLTAIEFEKTKIESAFVELAEFSNSYFAGKRLGTMLPASGLRHAFVLAEGVDVNGSELVRGFRESLPEGVLATGGLAADLDHFASTEILWQDQLHAKAVGAIGFYGDSLKIGHGSLGGWDAFGPERTITKSDKNILYELDGEPALALYKKYLGKYASQLPASALLFPLELRVGGASGLVRTILGIDDTDGSMTFAGDMPTGARVTLMKANFERLIEGATGAARSSLNHSGHSPELAILISCVGRKLVLKQRAEEEVEAVASIIGGQARLCGFYSYGEISPTLSTITSGGQCELHNQTMTITTLSE